MLMEGANLPKTKYYTEINYWTRILYNILDKKQTINDSWEDQRFWYVEMVHIKMRFVLIGSDVERYV